MRRIRATILKPRQLNTLDNTVKEACPDLSANMATSTFNPPCYSKEEIAEAITDNSKNNFSKVIGLPYFCGGAEKSKTAPHLKCAVSAIQWIADIDNRTKGNWDDEGRVELAKTYALDSAYTHITHCATKYKRVWKDVKDAFLEIYPEERSLPSLMGELSSVTRQPGETLTELYIRIEALVDKLESRKPTGKEVFEDMFVSIFLQALPKDFSYILQEAELKKPLTVYKKALKYVASHPNLQLTDEAIRKEVKSTTINVISETKPATEPYKPPVVRERMRCQRCNQIGHVIQTCRASECYRCHRYGHIARFCTVRSPQSYRSTVTCFTCGMIGHTNRECRNVQWNQKKKRRCAISSSSSS